MMNQSGDDRPYSIEEIAKIIAICDQRNKAMVNAHAFFWN